MCLIISKSWKLKIIFPSFWSITPPQCVQVDPRSFLINLARDEKSRQAGGEDQQIIWENFSYVFFFNILHEMLLYVDVFSKTEYLLLSSVADLKHLRNLWGFKNRNFRWKSTNFELSRYAEFAPFTLSCLALTFFTDFLCFSNISITWKCQHHSLHNLKHLKIFTKFNTKYKPHLQSLKCQHLHLLFPCFGKSATHARQVYWQTIQTAMP